MAVIFPISITFILFILLAGFGIVGRTIIPIVDWITNYWWIIGIIFILFAIIQVITSKRKWKYLFFIFDIPRLIALLFMVRLLASNCTNLNEGGLSIFFVILEFIIGGGILLCILGYGTGQCMLALYGSDDENESLVKYILGTVIYVFGALIYWVLAG